MHRYRTPGVRFEWLDTPPAITPRAGPTSPASSASPRAGRCTDAVRVESWTQFTSVFGAHIPQGVPRLRGRGVLRQRRRTCWVVRVADPATARERPRVDLLDGGGLPALRLDGRDARGPGARQVAVTVAPHRRPTASRSPCELPDGGAASCGAT